jgi:hypothetical protein
MEVTETPEYKRGIAWADQNRARLAELYSSKEIDTPELRSRLFEIAEGFYPKITGKQRDSMENDLKQTLFVMGAFRRLIDTLPVSREALLAVMDVAMEMGSIYSAELAKSEYLELLKKRDKRWWKTKYGDATPEKIVTCLSYTWWRTIGFPEDRAQTTKWEVLIDTTGLREMAALATLSSIELVKDGDYVHYEVHGHEGSFDIMAEDVVKDGITVQYRGDIVG